ncbi:unnamed protein product [Closterium sp. NIES-54]
MASRVLVSGLPRSLPPLPPGPGPTCVPCVEGRQRAAPHSSQFPPTEAPLQTLHMDVWGPARVRGQGHERYFLLVVDDYSRYTTVFPLRSKGDATEVLINWIRAACLQLRQSFGSDFPVLRLHSDRCGEFSSGLLRAYCCARGIRQTFTLLDSPQQNGIAECRIGMVMDVARTSMMHAAAPHFLWPFAVRYAAHQINLQPRVSMPETSPALLWTGTVGDASAFHVWGSRAFVRDFSADKLSPRAAPCVFLGFPPDAPGWQFYHPTSRRVLSSQDGPAPSGVSQVDAVEPVEVAGDSGAAEGAEPGGADSGGAERVGAESGGAEPGGAEPGGATPGGVEPGGAEPGGAGPAGTVPRGSPGASPRREPLSPQELRSVAAEGAGATGPGGARTGSTGAARPAGTFDAGAAAGVGAEATGSVGPGGGPAGGTTGAVGGTGAGATTGAGAVPAVSGVAARPRPYFVPLLQQVLGLPSSTGPSPPLECPQPVPSQFQLQPASPLPAPSPYTGPTGGLAERREPTSRPVSPARAACSSGRVSRQRPPPVPGTHLTSLRPSTAPLHAPLPSPPESPLPALADPESDSLRAASPTVTRLLATVVTDPSFESTAASALVAELVQFAARCRLDYATSLVAKSASVCPPSVGGDPDALDIPTPRSYAEAIEGPYSSQWQAAMDAKMASWKSTGTYVDEVPPPGANIVSGMWIFRVKRPPGSPLVFKARYVARGFSQWQGVDYFQTFSPTPKMTTLRVLLHIAAQRDYELHSLDFSTAFLQGSLHEEIWIRRPPGFTGSFPPGTQWSLRRPVYGLRQAPREWHDTLRTTLAALGFAPSTADPSLFLRTDTSLPPFYILVYVDNLIFATADTVGLAHVKSELQKRHTCTDLGELRSYFGLQITRDRAQRTVTLTQSHMVQQVFQRFGFTYSSPQATPLPTHHSLSALPSDESVESSGPYPELVGCLMYLMTCTRPDLAYPLSILARYAAPGRHRPEHMAAAKRVLRYLCSTSSLGLVLGGRSPVVLTGHADASWADDQATQRSSQGYTFSLGSGSVSWWATRSSSVLGSSCEAEIYAGAMAAEELRWLTYLLTDFGEVLRSPPVLYVDNKAMLALCREQRLEHRTKHIALRYFLARELQQRGQLRLAYMASEANTTDIFTKALAPCDHQRFCTQLGLGRPVQFDTWLNDLQVYLLSDSKDSVSLFDLATGAASAPPATADSANRSQWLTRDAAARLAICNHLPLAECAHFGQHKTAQALYDAVVARYSSPATTALGRLLLPYLFPEMSAFATVEDLVSHLHACNARYRAAAPTEILEKNQPPMFITLYFIVTRFLDSLRSVRDHFLSLDPTSLTVDLLEQHLLAAETSAVAVGAARGTPRPPFFEGCSPSPLAPSYASAAAAADVSVTDDVGAASASAKRRTRKGKGGRGGGGGSGGGGGGSGSSGGGSSGGGGGGGTGGGSGGSGGGGGGSGGSGGSGGGGTGGGGTSARRVGSGGGQRQQQQCRSETQSPQQLHLLRSRIAIFDLDFDVILSTMYALSVSDEGDSYRCLPPDPGIATTALGASESGNLPGSAPAQALHTFRLDSGASRCFFRDSTTLTLPAPVPIRLADPSGGPVVARSSTVLLCPAVLSSSLSGLHLPSLSTNLVSTAALQDAMVTTTTPGGQRVSICMCTRMGRHLATFTRWPGSSLYTLATKPPQVAASAQVSASPPALACPTLPSVRQGAAARRSSLLLVSPDDCSTADSPHGLRLQLRERFGQDLPVLRVHSHTGGEFSSNLLRDFCCGEGILHSFTLQDSPKQNGIAERRIGLVMEVARTSMIHAGAPHFLWPFAVQYTAHQLNLWPRVSLPETSPTLRWTGKVGDGSVFRVWGSRAIVRDTSADKLPACAIPCVFLVFVPDAPGWQFYHPTSRRVLPTQDVMFDESVPFYRLFPYRSAPPPPPPLFLAPGPPPVDPLPPQGPAPSGMSQVDPLLGTAPVEVAVGSGAAPGAASGGAASGGAERGGAGSEGAVSRSTEPEGVEPGGAESEGAESGGAEPRGAASSGDAGAGGAGVTAGAGGTEGAASAGPGGARTNGAGADETGGVGGARAGDPTEPGPAGAGGSCAGGAGARGTGAGGAGVVGTSAGGARAAGAGGPDPGAGGAAGTVRPRPYFDPLLQQPASPLPAPSPYTEPSGGLTESREPASRPVLPVRTARRVPRSRPPRVPGMHAMALRPSFVPLRVPLPAPPESSLPEVPDPESDRARAASPTVSRLLATPVTNHSFESAVAPALVAELLDFAAACRLDYGTALVAESASASPPSVGVECALGTGVLEDRQEEFECLAAAVPRFASMLLAPEGDPDAPDIPTPRSYAEAITGTYVDEVPPPGANIVDGMWIFRVKRPPGSPPAFKARYVARGFSQRQGVDYFQTFSPTSKMTTLQVLLHIAAQRDYELHSLDFSTAFLQGSLHEEIWLRCPPGFIESFPEGTQWSLRRPVYGLRQAPREWHDTLRTTLAALGFAPATADPSLFLRTDTSLLLFYIVVYVDDLVFATADTKALTLVKSELQKRHTCTDLGELCSYLGL